MNEQGISQQQTERKWHALEEKDVLTALQCGSDGLDEQEATRRLEQYGRNELPHRKPPTLLEIIFNQVKNPLIFILAVAAVASVAIGESADALFILAVIIINSTLGAYQEYQAERSAAALQQMLKTSARVRRGGKARNVPAEEVVPGDIVLLESGNKVAADIRLLEVKGLAADESFLTGESIPSEKHTGTLIDQTVVGDRKNIAFAGATITTGRAKGIVVATGAHTEVGIIAKTVAESESGKPPLILRMERFVKHIFMGLMVVCAVIAAILLMKGESIPAVLFLVIALSVSAIPEGLPVALTVALSVAAKRMSRRNVIVRQLTAVESLGSCTVIASDKTGTLTVNQQTARTVSLPCGKTFNVSGEGYNGIGQVSANGSGDGSISDTDRETLNRLAGLSILANEGSLVQEDGRWNSSGDAMDVAFISMGYKLGLNPADVRQKARVTHEIPYESLLKYSAVFFENDGTGYMAAKGAVETVLDFCTHAIQDGKRVELDRAKIDAQAVALAEKGLRVLAVAGGESVNGAAPGHEALTGMALYGLVGFIDPLRPEVIDAVKECKVAGIKVLMITGDHPSTAEAIARELGLSANGEPVVTGMQLTEAGGPDDPVFKELVLSTHVFARVSPSQKLEIVDVLIKAGEFVAVTGDGVNDTPALRRANIGVAMGSGTDAAKEVAPMIVIDDNFASIVAGVEEGRFAYDNVRKVTYLLISTGAAEVVMFLLALALGLPIPLLAAQLLWLNLVTNGIQDVALALEGGEPGAMKRKPRDPDERMFDPLMIWQTVVSGATMGLIAFAFWYWLVHTPRFNIVEGRNLVLMLMVLFENVHVFNCRSERTSAFKVPLRRNPILIVGTVAAQLIHIACLYTPFMQKVLQVEPVRYWHWKLLLIMALSLLVVMELFKVVRKKYVAAMVRKGAFEA